MYHISKDKRSAASAELIYQGLLKCIKKKSFDLTTISDIQKASGVARSTFYRQFDNISDVLYWKCDTCFAEVLGSFQPAEFLSEIELARHYFAYWIKNSDILSLLLKINRQDIIYACHMKNARLMQERFGQLPGIDETRSRYFMAVRTGLTISVLTAWLQGGKKESTDEIINILEEQLLFLGTKNFM
ncbi:MAG: TetR/AcrR family transcriptional regulator [Oscillospiraceae bacterium]